LKCLLGILQSMIISRTVNILKIATKLSTKVSVASAVRRIQKKMLKLSYFQRFAAFGRSVQ
ncbi:hypothetical protein, partial [uncultured Duncaniella sp.]|uniref:hypothetical protein n=1 Tax=uncultured Duncaniella sp. TaxID=2768039 RepID=UPI0025B6CB25